MGTNICHDNITAKNFSNTNYNKHESFNLSRAGWLCDRTDKA